VLRSGNGGLIERDRNEFMYAVIAKIGQGQQESVIPKSGVKFAVFVQICPKIAVSPGNLCSS
jgi:hypothetical protein